MTTDVPTRMISRQTAFACGAPDCGRDAEHTCHHCKRSLCAWHYALQPVASDTPKRGRPADRGNGVDIVRVCMSACAALYWSGR